MLRVEGSLKYNDNFLPCGQCGIAPLNYILLSFILQDVYVAGLSSQNSVGGDLSFHLLLVKSIGLLRMTKE